jgi:hypothetical protein
MDREAWAHEVEDDSAAHAHRLPGIGYVSQVPRSNLRVTFDVDRQTRRITLKRIDTQGP